LLGGGAGSTGCTLTNSTGEFTCTILSASALKWNALTSPDGALTLAHGVNPTTFGWTPTGALDAFTLNLVNNGGSATTQNGLVINNAVAGSFTDVSTESLLLLQQLDTTVAGTTALASALKIDSAANSGMTNGINITNSAGNLTTGINIADTAGGTLTTGLGFSGTFTSEISLSNAETISNQVDGTLNLGTTILQLTGGTSLVTDQTTFDLFNTATTTLNVAGVATTLSLGAGGALTRAINLGTGTGADTINIGTGATLADAINIGGLATTATNFTGIVNFGGGTTYYVDASGNLNANAGTFAATLDANGVFTLGDGGDTGAIDTSDWDINATGDMTNIGAVTANGLLTLSNDATMSGVLTVGNGTTNTIRTPFGPLNLAYKSGLNTWATGLTLQDTTGNVGIGTTAPTQKLEVNGNVAAQIFQDTAGTSTWFLDASSGTTSLAIQGDITNLDTANPFSISSSNDQDITINAGAGTVVIGASGAGKLDAATIDPPYTINGSKFATYMAGMTGVKEETTGNVRTEEYVPGVGYRATLDLADSPEGSDLWLFAKASNLQNTLDKLVVLLSSSGSTKTWYELDALRGKLYLYALSPTTISYRLTAPRFDSYAWLNTRDSSSTGLVVNDEGPWSVPEAIAAYFQPTPTPPLTPLPAGEPVTLTGPVIISHEPSTMSYEPLLTVDGELAAATISARVAILTDVQADTITARNIVADTIAANHIIGLDARIASLSAGLSDTEVETITDRIKARLADFAGVAPSAQDLPIPPEATASSTTYDLQSTISTASASLESSDIDFVTINNYLAVIGQATITTLDVTANLYTASIDSKTGIINLAQSTLVVDATGQVMINGDLTVRGKIVATELNLERLNVYNESGQAVATIDASGSANLASLTTNMITIASPPTASDSSTIYDLLPTITSNATAGESILSSPNTELTIESPYVTPNSLVYLTPTTNTDNKVLFVKSKNEKSFTVAIDTPATSDISFNWWIIQLKP
jgi:hypothetical protein